MARKCKGLKANGRLRPGFKWPGGGKCPVKASARKQRSDKGKSRSKRSYDTGGGYAKGYEAWKSGASGRALSKNLETYQEMHGARRKKRRRR